jgi:flagellar motor protein MotB
MSKRQPQEESAGEKAPLWILSFGDMITNFLAFFILMQSFAHAQKADLLQTGETGGKVNVGNLGSAPGWLMGKNTQPEFGFWQRKHPMETDTSNLTIERVMDAEDEEIRKLFDDLRRSAKTDASGRDRARTQLFPTPIRFAPTSAVLDAAAMDYLATFASELGQAAGKDQSSIYVIGTAAEAATDQAAIVVSALRAQAVRDCLARNLPSDGRGDTGRVLSWGMGRTAAGSKAAAALGASASASPPTIIIAVVEQTREE